MTEVEVQTKQSTLRYSGKIRKILLVFLILQIFFYLFSLFGRAPDIDDAWIGEHAYWMAKTGHAKSELMRGWQQQEERILIHHKLMTLTGYSVIKLFGFSLIALKSVSLLFFGLFLLAFYYFTRKRHQVLSQTQFIIALLLFFTFHYTFKFSFIFRPEMIIMFFTFISFMLLSKVINSTNQISRISSSGLLLLAGILSGLCGVAHLNGLAVVLAGGLLLLVNRKLMALPIFLLGSVISFSLYFYDFSAEYGFTFWKQQLFQSVLGNNGGATDVISYMANSFLKEHMRFFHDFSIIGFSLLLILSLLVGYKHLKKEHQTMLQYTLILWLMVAFLFTQKSRQYILIYLPFLVICMSIIIDMFINRREELRKWIFKPVGRILFYVFVLLFIGGSEIFNIRVFSEKFNPALNRQFVSEYIGNDVADKKIVAPMEFIFNEILYFERIQGERLYTSLQQRDSTIYGEGFFAKAAGFGVDYILLSGVYRENLGVNKLDKNTIYSGYKFVVDNGELRLYERVYY
jgi:hypothetical protein